MNRIKKGILPALIIITLITSGCSSLNKTQKGAAVGTVSGGAMGAVIGKATGNTALGAIIGATVGGTAGAIIGNKMDKQAAEIAKSVPDVQVIRVGEGIVVEFSSSILFGFDQSNLSSDAKTKLDKLVNILKEYPDTNIEVQGHTDSKGSEAYNQRLSEERATKVSVYLVENGIKSDRLKINGFGELLPKYINTTEDGRSMNRRVEFLISANDKMKADAEKQAGQ
ncbi:MAG: OmpA family protein [Saprospiraceae bacterium]|nr:OmpA family protein [Saprospiraceae bacterium]